jgi:hypothetical protein
MPACPHGMAWGPQMDDTVTSTWGSMGFMHGMGHGY